MLQMRSISFVRKIVGIRSISMYQRDSAGFGAQRPMFTPKDGVVWTCAQCGAEITELPFQPRTDANGVPSAPLYCRDCHRSRMQDSGPRRRY